MERAKVFLKRFLSLPHPPSWLQATPKGWKAQDHGGLPLKREVPGLPELAEDLRAWTIEEEIERATLLLAPKGAGLFWVGRGEGWVVEWGHASYPKRRGRKNGSG